MIKQSFPVFRYKKFDDEWLIDTLKNIAEFKKGNGYTKNDLVEAGQPILLYGQLYTNYQSVIKDITTYVRSIKKNTVFSNVGDVVVPASGESAEEISRASVVAVENVILGGDLNIIHPNNFKLDSNFLALTISNGTQQKELIKRAQGKSVVHIRNNDLEKVKVAFPSLPEQSAIGTLFQTLDELLSAYKDNLANYQVFKATMLSKMFPKGGQTTPEIRLDGFDGEWEEKKLGELADIVRGSSPRPIQDPKWFDELSEIGWLRISDVTNQNGRIHYLEQRISELGQEKTRVLKEPHLLLSIAASVGKPVINYVQTGVHDGFLIFLNPTFDKEFMFQWLEIFKDGWNKYGQPGSQVNLNSDIVRNHSLSIPSLQEQRAIGVFFANLDDLIASQQAKITELETLKKKLLQDMFV